MPPFKIALPVVVTTMLASAVVFGPDLSDGQGNANPPAALENPPLLVRTPPATTEPVVAITVAARDVGAGVVQIDVDLNHDGQFQGPGELGYAQGLLNAEGTATVRLHGLVAGTYHLRARLTRPTGQDMVSRAQRLQMLPPPANRLPASFERNQGQTDSQVLFLGRMQDRLVYITATEAVLVTTPPASCGGKFPTCRENARQVGNLPPQKTAQVQRFRLLGADATALPRGQKQLPGISNYFAGNDPRQWRTNIATYQEVVRPGVYPGIDLVYYSSQGRLEYDFRVAAGADPSVIDLEFPDVRDLSIDEDGALVLHLPDGETLRKGAPVMYQEQRGRRQAVKGDWTLKGHHRAGYVVASYDPGRELVIDPLIFSTYYGGAADDMASYSSIAVDAAANTFVTGSTASANFPTSPGAYDTAPWPGPIPDTSAFVVKLNPSGTAVLYATYLGAAGPAAGGGPNIGRGIAVDAAGNAYVVGSTTCGPPTPFPTTAGAFQVALGGPVGPTSNQFVTKLNPTGTALLYSTYLGGMGDDQAYAVAVDAAGNAYVTGNSSSMNFPTTPGAYQMVNNSAGGLNSTITKLNATGSALIYSTYLGGVGPEHGHAIAIDATGNAYAAGRTGSFNFPTTPGAFQTVFGGVENAYVTKLNPGGTARLYSTFVGGSGTDWGNGIVVDGAGNAYLSGKTSSNPFPTTPGAFQTTFQGGANDAFVTKLNPAGSALVYSTYLGGTGDDQGFGIALDTAGNAYVTGQAGNNTFPKTANATQATFGGGGSDACVTQLNATGSALLFSTFLGGSGADSGAGIAVAASGAIYVTGTTSSVDFPTLNAVHASNGGGQDMFITKLSANAPSPPASSSPPPGGAGSEGSFAGTQDPGMGGQEGAFGVGSNFMLALPAGMPRRGAILAGPYLDSPGSGKTLAPVQFAAAPPPSSRLRVYNISGQVTAQSKTAQATSPPVGALGWSVLAALVLVGAIALGTLLRPKAA